MNNNFMGYVELIIQAVWAMINLPYYFGSYKITLFGVVCFAIVFTYFYRILFGEGGGDNK